MAGFFALGEQKVRPGAYLRYENGSGIVSASAQNGVVAALFKGNFGPMGEVVSLGSESEIIKYFGPSGVDIASAALLGGAKEIKCVRVGNGGTKASITLKDTANNPANVVRIFAKYEGSLPLSVTIRDSISNPDGRECIIYSGLTQIAKFAFAGGSEEVAGLVDAINANSDSIIGATKVADGNGILAAVTQTPFTAGTDPTVTVSDYSAAADLLESHQWNVLVTDSDDASVQAVMAAFIKRVTESGLLVMGVFGEPTSIAFATRKAHASAFNDAGIVYVINGFKIGDVAYEGYKAAAMIGGLIACVPSSESLTHRTIPSATDIIGELTNTQIIECIKAGALCITRSSAGSVWIEAAINTLVILLGEQDDGWKKIRRTKTRYELMTRVQATVEPLIGKINNNTDGRSTFMMAAQGVINEMISEGKLESGSVKEDPSNPPKGDSAWFIVAVDDIDSMEKTYTTFVFRFAAE